MKCAGWSRGSLSTASLLALLSLLALVPAGASGAGVSLQPSEGGAFTSGLPIPADSRANPEPEATVLVTTTADFLEGNDEGNVSFDEDAISCGRPSGGILGAWETSTVAYRYDHASVAYNGYLYMLGGKDSGPLSSVAFAPISGGAAGPWNSATSLPSARYLHTAVAYNGFIYVTGGRDATAARSDVWIAHIHADGTLGSWVPGPNLPGALSQHSSVAYDGYLYILNGVTGQVVFSEIRPEGSLGSWTATTSFPAGASGNNAFVWNGNLYFVDSHPFHYVVRFAPIRADGTVGTWGVAGQPPSPSNSDFAVVAYRGYLYQLGGVPWMGSPSSRTYYAPIYANGKIGTGTWTRLAPHEMTSHTAVACGGYIYASLGSRLMTAPVVPDTPGAPLSCWVSDTELREGRAYHSTAASSPHVYLIGGKTASGTTNSVERVDIGFDGTVAGAYSMTSLPVPLYEHASVAANGFVYVFGDGVSRDRILRSPIDGSGNLGAWTDIGNFPVEKGWYLDAAHHNGYIYVIGATTGGLDNNVLFAPVNADGSLGTWSYAATNTPFLNIHDRIVIRNGLFYVVGAYSTTLGDVFFAPVNANGTLGSWTQTASMPVAMKRGACTVVNDILYVLGGGIYGEYTSSDAVVSAPFRTDGTLGEWETLCDLQGGGGAGTTALSYDYLFFLGGIPTGMMALPSDQVQTARVRSVGTADTWATSATPLPTARHYLRAISAHGTLYALGGTDSTVYLNQVLSAAIGPDGSLGAWTARASFATPRVNHAVASYGNFLYILGGDGGGFKNDVQVARIDEDGSLWPWVVTTNFATGRYGHAAVAFEGHLFVTGGVSAGGRMNDIQVADIGADGTLSAWRTLSQTLPGGVAREGLTAVAYNGYLYIMGGSGTGYLSDVYYAAIQADGSLGGWVSIRSFTTPRWYHTSAVYGGHLCVMGGGTSGGFLSDCQCAPIRGDGSLGTWIQGATFATAREHHAAAVSDGTLFVLGGWGGSRLSDVQSASLKTQAARAAYSKRLDLGSEHLFQQFYFTNSGASPRSTFNVRCDIQNSTGGPVHRLSFPACQPGVPDWVSSCSRYFRFRFDLDDRECVTMGGPAGDVQSLGLLAIPMATGDTLGVVKTGSVHLTWGSSWGPYEVRRCDSSSGPCTPTAIATTGDTSYDDPVLDDGTSYWYEVETLCTSY